jgi:thiol:disulfide interchange protein DsbA
MKSIFALSAFFLLALAACSSEKEAAEPIAADAEVQQPADDTTATPADSDEIVASDERPQAVEESGGEPDEADAGDKPIILAQAASPATDQNWQFSEGEHFHRLVPTQPTLGGADKIEVAEIFWYGCGHCYEFENYINSWEESLPANARFVRIPATWNPLVKLHAQLYYTEQVLVKNGKISDPKGFREAVFAEYHRRNNRLTSLAAIEALFASAGVSADEFNGTWSSFEVAQKLRVAQDLARRYAITGVPAVVVNGKYRTGKTETGTYPKLLEVVDELIQRETVR